jgi:hypothetical protein
MIDNRARKKTKKDGLLLPKTGNKLLSAGGAFAGKPAEMEPKQIRLEPHDLNPQPPLAK